MVTIHSITKTQGVAGQVAYIARVEYENEAQSVVTFVGSEYGGPVVMVTEHAQHFVTDPGRFGKFGPQWVRNFFAD
jgi:hypothetical protein